jgi:hypothetical protein
MFDMSEKAELSDNPDRQPDREAKAYPINHPKLINGDSHIISELSGYADDLDKKVPFMAHLTMDDKELWENWDGTEPWKLSVFRDVWGEEFTTSDGEVRSTGIVSASTHKWWPNELHIQGPLSWSMVQVVEKQRYVGQEFYEQENGSNMAGYADTKENLYHIEKRHLKGEELWAGFGKGDDFPAFSCLKDEDGVVSLYLYGVNFAVKIINYKGVTTEVAVYQQERYSSFAPNKLTYYWASDECKSIYKRLGNSNSTTKTNKKSKTKTKSPKMFMILGGLIGAVFLLNLA